jgi:hypothetical protein
VIRLTSMALLASSLLLLGCETHHDHRYSDRGDGSVSRCTAPAVGQCAGCEVSCTRSDEAYCEPGHSTPAQGQVAGYCSEESRCVCRE